MTEAVDRRVNLAALRRFFAQEDLNFLLTNRVPRMALTRLMGRISRIKSPLFTRAAIAVWRLFTDLDLREARQQRFDSIHDCFTRELRDGARSVDIRPDRLTSPCDAIVGACGTVVRGQVLQAKGMPYAMADLFGPTQDSTVFEGGCYVTLRLTSAMVHRFHAPHDATLEHVTYLSGDTWNVQPIALVPVAAILVASIRLHALDVLLHLKRRGANEMPCSATLTKGQEMGWFEHGSTIIVFTPPGFALCEGIAPGVTLRMGQALLRLPS